MPKVHEKVFPADPKVMVGIPVGPDCGLTPAQISLVCKSLTGAHSFCYVDDGADLPSATVKLAPAPKGMGKVDRIARARNAVRERFLKSDCTHLYFHDADVVPPADIIPRLLALKAPIATGLCPLRRWGELGVPILSLSVNGAPGVMMGAQHLQGDVIACGMACCLIEREVLERVPFRQGKALGGVSEDFKFCEDAGVRPALDPNCACWHVDGDGSAGRIVVGERRKGVVYEDQPFFVSNRFGSWTAGLPRFDLTEAQMEMLGPGFTRGEFQLLSLETSRAEEVLSDLQPVQPQAGPASP